MPSLANIYRVYIFRKKDRVPNLVFQRSVRVVKGAAEQVGFFQGHK